MPDDAHADAPDHPTLAVIKSDFNAAVPLQATAFRGRSTVVVDRGDVHALLSFLKTDPRCGYDFLSDIVGVDYLNYPKPRAGGPTGRFGVVYNLESTTHNTRLLVKVLLDPTLDTHGTDDDLSLIHI